MQQKSTRQVYESVGWDLCKMYICSRNMDKTCRAAAGQGARTLPVFYARPFQNVPAQRRKTPKQPVSLQKIKILRIARFFRDFFGNTLDIPAGML